MAPSKSLRCNDRIRISPIRLIDQDDQQIGVIETLKALDMAREANLDLVEVAPQSDPPVCRIMDYGKWKYAQNKKQRRSKAHRHEVELKEIRIKTPKIDPHDLMIKVNRARGFLERGDRVQFTLRFRGRELAHIDEGLKVFESVKVALEGTSKVDQFPRREGRRITMLLAPTGSKKPAEKPADKSDERDSAPAAAPAAAPAPAPAAAPPAVPPAADAPPAS